MIIKLIQHSEQEVQELKRKLGKYNEELLRQTLSFVFDTTYLNKVLIHQHTYLHIYLQFIDMYVCFCVRGDSFKRKVRNTESERKINVLEIMCSPVERRDGRRGWRMTNIRQAKNKDEGGVSTSTISLSIKPNNVSRSGRSI